VELRAAFNLLWLFTFEPDTVYFARVERGDVLSGDLRVSNFVQGNRAYLLNAPSGEYMAVGAEYVTYEDECEITHTIFFSREMIEATRTIAAPGELGFMGAWLAREHSLDRADQAQRHYAELIKPLAYHASHPEEEDRSDTARASFFEAAREDFGKTPWVDWLGASAPP
jgi:hypothetical protein